MLPVQVKCPNCGAGVSKIPVSGNIVCPYCKQTFSVPTTNNQSGNPISGYYDVIIDQKKALSHLIDALVEHKDIPEDIFTALRVDKSACIYVPMYRFEVSYAAPWNITIEWTTKKQVFDGYDNQGKKSYRDEIDVHTRGESGIATGNKLIAVSAMTIQSKNELGEYTFIIDDKNIHPIGSFTSQIPVLQSNLSEGQALLQCRIREIMKTEAEDKVSAMILSAIRPNEKLVNRNCNFSHNQQVRDAVLIPIWKFCCSYKKKQFTFLMRAFEENKGNLYSPPEDSNSNVNQQISHYNDLLSDESEQEDKIENWEIGFCITAIIAGIIGIFATPVLIVAAVFLLLFIILLIKRIKHSNAAQDLQSKIDSLYSDRKDRLRSSAERLKRHWGLPK